MAKRDESARLACGSPLSLGNVAVRGRLRIALLGAVFAAAAAGALANAALSVSHAPVADSDPSIAPLADPVATAPVDTMTNAKQPAVEASALATLGLTLVSRTTALDGAGDVWLTAVRRALRRPGHQGRILRP